MELNEFYNLIHEDERLRSKAGLIEYRTTCREQINGFDDTYYEKWMQYHFQVCEKPEMLGYSNHVLMITQK